MIQLVFGTLRFFEARFLHTAQKEKKLFPYILKLLMGSSIFHLCFFLSFFFTGAHFILVLLLLSLISLIPFSFLIYRIIQFSQPGNSLPKLIEFYEKDKNSLIEAVTSSLVKNLAICSIILAVLCAYYLLIYGICFLFISSTILHFFLSFLIVGLVTGIVLYCLFLYVFSKNKELLWPKIILPVISGFSGFLFLLCINPFVPIKPDFMYVFSFSCAWFFTFPLIRALSGDKNLIISYRFILLCYSILLVLFFISFFEMDFFSYFRFPENPFIRPLANIPGLFTAYLKDHFFSNIFIILVPHLFVPILLLCSTLYDFVFRLRHAITGAIYSSCLSYYPLFRLFFRAFIIIGILYCEITPVSDVLYSLINIFRLQELFHLTFLTPENVHFFFTLIWYITVFMFGVKCIDGIIMHLFSTITLFPEEFVYKEVRLFTKSVLRIPVRKISYIMYHQKICERVCNTGSFHIETPDTSHYLSIKNIPGIKEKYTLLCEKVKCGI